MSAVEANLDGLVGPTHNYAGLSFGNVASEKHAHSVANPKRAALEGLRKMKFVRDLGIPQLVMPPQPRPAWAVLHRLGYKTLNDAPDEVLYSISSASSMWTANAATVSPAADTAEGKTHFTPANLLTKFHRSIETATTAHYLKQIFSGPRFVHHDPLPTHARYADEGAANHMRLARTHGERGWEIFVYGGAAKKYPARQTRAAGEAVARLHDLGKERTLFLEQSPSAIDGGVFHNDVIAMSNGLLLICHERAYENPVTFGSGISIRVVREHELPLLEAVSTYFFNSQLVTLPGGAAALIAPRECEENPRAFSCLTRLRDEGHVAQLHFLDVRESMKNGGGPACLRLRVVLTEAERADVHAGAWLTDERYALLSGWIEKSYRDRVVPADLRDPSLARESEHALEELATLIDMRAA